MTKRIISVALYEEVAARLREAIYTQQIKPGQWIDEQQLAEVYGISRTPLREALKLLNAEGLVTLKPRRGCFVRELTAQDLDEIFPVMALLEGRCAFEAARKATPADLKKLEDIHARLQRYAASGDISRYYEYNYVFHETVQNLAGNPWLLRITNELRKFLRMLRGRQLQLPGRMQQSLREHDQIMTAFRKGDAAAAEKIMHDHLMQQRAALAAHDTMQQAAYPAADASPTDAGGAGSPKPARRKAGRGVATSAVEG